MEKSEESAHSSDPKLEPTQIEQAKLENLLLQSEYKFAKDIKSLQTALLTARRLGVLNLIGLHLRLVFITESGKTLPAERALYKWKSRCVASNAGRNKVLLRVIRSMNRTTLTRAFFVLKERRFNKILADIQVDGPTYARGAVAPLSSDDDDLDI